MQPLNLNIKLNLRDKVSGSLGKDSFIALPSKGDYSGLMPSKLCLNLEALVRSFIVMVQRGGCDQLMDNSSDWLVGRKLGVSTINLPVPMRLRSSACGHTVNCSYLVGLSVYTKQLKNNFSVYPLRGKQDPAPQGSLLFLDCSFLITAYTPTLLY